MSSKKIFQSYLLNNELEKRKARNSQYSLRSFAKDLKIEPSSLSRVIAQKSTLSKDTAKVIASLLKLPPNETILFVEGRILKPASNKIEGNLINYSIIAEWEHYAIFEFLSKHHPKSQANIEKAFEIPENRLNNVLQNLIDAQMIERTKENTYLKTINSLETQDDIKDRALVDSHIESAELAQEKLETVSLNLRDFSSVIIPTSPERLVMAKELIRKFRKDLANLIEIEESEDIYQCNIQLFPLTKTDE